MKGARQGRVIWSATSGINMGITSGSASGHCEKAQDLYGSTGQLVHICIDEWYYGKGEHSHTG